jgi:hypothetical protein
VCLCSDFIVYFLSLHVGHALLIKARLRLFWFELIGTACGSNADPTMTNRQVLIIGIR